MTFAYIYISICYDFRIQSSHYKGNFSKHLIFLYNLTFPYMHIMDFPQFVPTATEILHSNKFPPTWMNFLKIYGLLNLIRIFFAWVGAYLPEL